MTPEQVQFLGRMLRKAIDSEDGSQPELVVRLKAKDSAGREVEAIGYHRYARPNPRRPD